MESFNRMTAQVKASQDRLESSRRDLEMKNLELDRRRGYMETVLENITTGIISLGREGFVTRINQAALKMLQLDATLIGQHYRELFRDEELSALRVLLDEMGGIDSRSPLEEELDVSVQGRELHLSVYITALTGVDDVPSGQYYTNAVDWMAAEGITTGTSPTRFSPHDPVTRAQAVTFLWRDAGSPP